MKLRYWALFVAYIAAGLIVAKMEFIRSRAMYPNLPDDCHMSMTPMCVTMWPAVLFVWFVKWWATL